MNPFELPRGPLGHLAGRLMARTNAGSQREVAARMAVNAGERVLVVGSGPGLLVEHLLDAGAVVSGVDPSPVMRRPGGPPGRRAR